MDLHSSKKGMKNNSKHISLMLSIAWCIILGVLAYSIINHFADGNLSFPQVCSSEKCFTVELARTPAEQELGLMNRSFMAENSGMLFIFPQNDFYVFRMKNTLIPLDMVWIDTTLRVVKIITAQPCIAEPCAIYNPGIRATYVLEINSWSAAKYGIVEWTQMEFRNINK